MGTYRFRILVVVALCAAVVVGVAQIGTAVPSQDTVYIATGTNFPDALGAGSVAALDNAPILLVRTDSIPPATQAELDRLQPSRIVIVGGTGVVSDTVATELLALPYVATVERMSGLDRYATAAAISASKFPAVSLDDRIAQLEAENDALEARLGDLETLLASVSVNGDNLVIDGMNLQVVNGSGMTEYSANGLGNVIIGYDTGSGAKTGSHNLVIGDDHTYSSYSGIVSGFSNTLSGARSVIAGGDSNIASGYESFIGGGYGNTASGDYSFVGGGGTSTASGTYSFAGGGNGNQASKSRSFIGGGYLNAASGHDSFVGGGQQNEASGDFSFAGGGYSNSAIGEYSFIGGGQYGDAEALASFVGGGYGNTTSGDYSFVGGGNNNTASGGRSFVGGGEYNTASGVMSFVGGGNDNTASGYGSFVGGGQVDTAGPNTCGYVANTLIGSCS
jgi:hypothetical protein